MQTQAYELSALLTAADSIVLEWSLTFTKDFIEVQYINLLIVLFLLKTYSRVHFLIINIDTV